MASIFVLITSRRFQNGIFRRGASQTIQVIFFQPSSSPTFFFTILTALWKSSLLVQSSPSKAIPFGMASKNHQGGQNRFPFLEYILFPFQKHLTPSSFSDISQPLGFWLSGSQVLASMRSIEPETTGSFSFCSAFLMAQLAILDDYFN